MKIFTYRFTYKEPFWRQKDTKSYVKVHKGTFMELSDSHKISQEKRDFKISDVLITAWSRVQVLAGPYKKDTCVGVFFALEQKNRIFCKKYLQRGNSCGKIIEL